MKRMWYVQQKPLDYRPLRSGLGLINNDDLNAPGMQGLCPKIYTTRTRPMSGEYYVVEGSRFKAKPVVPHIRFKVVTESAELDLRRGIFKNGNMICGWAIANRNGLTFPELDLGIKGATFEQLRDELLRLNKKATIDTPFFVNLLEPISI